MVHPIVNAQAFSVSVKVPLVEVEKAEVERFEVKWLLARVLDLKVQVHRLAVLQVYLPKITVFPVA